jgi:hypothetical protein
MVTGTYGVISVVEGKGVVEAMMTLFQRWGSRTE